MDYVLKKSKKFGGRPGPLLLIIMDGVGIGKQDKGDAMWKAQPSFDNDIKDQLDKSISGERVDFFDAQLAVAVRIRLPKALLNEDKIVRLGYRQGAVFEILCG